MSVPNQNITKTIKIKPQKDFLMVSNEDWITACRNLTPSGFKMYLWLIRHDPSFNNELSKKAFMNDFNTSGSSYDRAWDELREKGYAVKKNKDSNIYYIYTTPQTTTPTSKMTLKKENNTKNDVEQQQKDTPPISSTSKMMLTNTKNDVNQHQNWCYLTPKMNIEIDNINNKDIINNCSNEQSFIIISQEDFIQQGLVPTMIVHEEDNEGNKIVESCGKTYKIIPPKQALTAQEQIAALGF